LRPASTFAASEAAFGSSARGDADALSDRDFLIVDDDVRVLRERSAVLRAEGISVASYTFRKLEHLSRVGALFVQHLRLEADISLDRDGRLGRLLMSFRPKSSYSAEIADNGALAGLIAQVPPGPLAEAWAADVLYVTVRNFGVLSLAERGRYVFAYGAILDALRDEGFLDGEAVGNLRQLRFIKSLYRSDATGGGGVVGQKVRTALAGLPHHQFPRVSSVVPSASVLSAPGPAEGGSAYLLLRDLEKRLIAARLLDGNQNLDDGLVELVKWIRNPRAYAHLAPGLAPEFRARLAALQYRHRLSRVS
jgi:hypothetical protein